MTGYTAAEAIGRSPAFLQGPGTDPVELGRLNDALRRYEAVHVELLTFHVRLPAIGTSEVRPPATTAVEEATPLGTRVLYVDDDEVLLVMVRALLEREGCKGTCIGSARDALEAVGTDPEAFDVVVSDFNMPAVSGLELARSLRAIRPDLPVVLTSGLVRDELMEALGAGEVQAVLGKEELHERLAGTLSEVLRRRSVF
jgi:CheY-like chemotaxis protein